jgi:hypothetical protein
VAPKCAGRVGSGELAVGSTVRLPRGEGLPSQSMLARKWEHAGSRNSRKRAEAALFFPTVRGVSAGRVRGKGGTWWLLIPLTKSEGYKGVLLGSWLPSRQSGEPKGVSSGPMAQGWSDAHVAVLLFNQQCNDSYVAAFLMNLRA